MYLLMCSRFSSSIFAAICLMVLSSIVFIVKSLITLSLSSSSPTIAADGICVTALILSLLACVAVSRFSFSSLVSAILILDRVLANSWP